MAPVTVKTGFSLGGIPPLDKVYPPVASITSPRVIEDSPTRLALSCGGPRGRVGRRSRQGTDSMRPARLTPIRRWPGRAAVGVGQGRATHLWL